MRSLTLSCGPNFESVLLRSHALLNRVVYGSLSVTVLLAVAVVDAFVAESGWGPGLLGPLLRRGSIVPIALTLVIVVGVLELISMLRAMGQKPHSVWALLSCIVLMLSPWLCAGELLGGSPLDVEGVQWQLFWCVVALGGAVAIHLYRGVTATAVSDLASTWLVIGYLGLLPSFAIQMRADATIGDGSSGVWRLLVVLAVSFISDIGAFFVGRNFGRHKLAPTLSPGKSVEGFVGGVLGSVVLILLMRFVALTVTPQPDISGSVGDGVEEFAARFLFCIKSLSTTQAIVCAVLISIASQIGDLFESLIKRCAQTKDSSALVPGMGGVLDVIDGTLFALPVAWFVLST